MKYHIHCEKCGADYDVDVEFTPGFCGQCGNHRIDLTRVKTKGRITAESKMEELESIRPRLGNAWNEYFAVRVEYEDVLQFLAQYHKRGLITEAEYDKYRVKEQGLKKDLSKAVAELRKKRREQNLTDDNTVS